MRTRWWIVVLALAVSMGFIACGGGGGGGGDSYPELAGTWFGVWEQHWDGDVAVQIPYTVEMTIDSKGRNITSVVENGDPISITGKISRDTDQTYNIDWSDDAYGGFLMDEGNEHIAYMDDFFYVGIFQKGASELPVYSEPDYEGTWTGHSIWVDEDLNITEEANTVITVNNQMDVIGTTVAGAFAGSLHGFVDITRGVASGTNSADTAFFHIFLSVDKQFAATYSCPNDYFDYYDCEFGGWEKQ